MSTRHLGKKWENVKFWKERRTCTGFYCRFRAASLALVIRSRKPPSAKKAFGLNQEGRNKERKATSV